MNEEPQSAKPLDSEAEVTPRPPRTWPTWIVLFPIFPVALVLVSLVVTVGALLVMEGPDLLGDSEGFQEWILALASDPMGLLILVLPGQFCFLALAIGAALFSSDPLSKRLGLVRPRYSRRIWVLLVLGSPIVQFVGAFLAGMFFDLTEMSEHMEMMSGLMTGQSGFLGLTLLILVVSVFPGFSEELFFRGYVRVGLGRRWGFMLAILVPAIIFALIHMDPVHATAVLPLGIWFGCLAWWSRSTIPAIGAHLMNNLVAILVAREATALQADSDAAGTTTAAMTELGMFALVGYGACLLLLLAGLWSLFIERAKPVESSAEMP